MIRLKVGLIRGAGVILALAVLLLAVSGCIFEPREPNPPSSGEETTWVVPYTPGDVFLNLASGFAGSSNSNYERSLHDDFTFKPLPADEAQLGSDVFADWTKQVELQVLTRLKGEYSSKRSIRFGDENGQLEKVKEEVGLVIYEGEYRIELDQGGATEVYSGIARLTVEQTSLGWMLKEWEDLDVNGNYPTSGNLRGRLRGGG